MTQIPFWYKIYSPNGYLTFGTHSLKWWQSFLVGEYFIEQHSKVLLVHNLAHNSTDISGILAISIPVISPVISKNPGREGPLMNMECHI